MTTMTAFTLEEALRRFDIVTDSNPESVRADDLHSLRDKSSPPLAERSPLVVEVDSEDYVRVVAQQFGLPLNEQGSRIFCRRWIPVLNEYLTYIYERETAA